MSRSMNGPVVTYNGTGESFSEMPGDRHTVSENASKTDPRNCWPCSWSIRTRRN